MRRFVLGGVFAVVVVSGVYGAATMSAAPADSWTVSNYYKQSIYDPNEVRIGTIDDVLVDKSGKVTGLVIGVDDVLGAREKNVIVTFDAVKAAQRDGKLWLTLDDTKDDLKNAPGFKYDRGSTTWVPVK
jgi:sporulation protein YlmC with PRC-barrel domain